MNKLFLKLPLQYKLFLIGLIPYFSLVYLTVQIYREKTAKLALFENYKTYISESSNISKLIDALQDEEKYSFDYAMTKGMHRELVLQRPKTDALIKRLETSGDQSLAGFTRYTRLKDLDAVRNNIDSGNSRPNDVMHYYSNTVFRMNTLNTLPPANTPYLEPVYKDLQTQKILSEMTTYFGIIRSNIYNVLYTRQYMIETLMGTVGTHDIYNSYEDELLSKASPEVVHDFKMLKDTTALKPSMAYIEKLFSKFAFDDSYTATQWWEISNNASDEMRTFQANVQKRIVSDINKLYDAEVRSRDRVFYFLVFALFSILVVVSYIIYLIQRLMVRLRRATEKIARGEINVKVGVESDDVIGELGKSISLIDQNNRTLAKAAAQIGKGDFDVNLKPRSNGDILSNAIITMKDDLRQYNGKMEQLVAQRTEELSRSNDDLQQFAHVASHDLKEPLRKVAMFSNIVINEQQNQLTEKSKVYLQKIEVAANRMSHMIEGVLSYSTINMQQPDFERIDLNKTLEGVENDLELAILQKDATLVYNDLPSIHGIPLLIHQLMYNLINNALKFSRADVPPVITIGAILETDSNPKKGRSVHLTITDNGIGFNPAYNERIFGIFSRLNGKDKYEGTGLGLALCRKIVIRHNGTIYAEGIEGSGATFHIVLPE